MTSHSPAVGTGVNNAYLIASRHPLARLYNDNSVLENSHISALYNLMAAQPELDVFAGQSAEGWRDARKLVIHAILHTDMTYHFPLVSQVRCRLYSRAWDQFACYPAVRHDLPLAPRVPGTLWLLIPSLGSVCVPCRAGTCPALPACEQLWLACMRHAQQPMAHAAKL